MVAIAIQFEHTNIRCGVADIKQHSNSYEIGEHLMNGLMTDDLTSVFIISDGTHINGSDLGTRLNEHNQLNGRNIAVTSVLTADGLHFGETLFWFKLFDIGSKSIFFFIWYMA